MACKILDLEEFREKRKIITACVEGQKLMSQRDKDQKTWDYYMRCWFGETITEGDEKDDV